MMVDAVIWCYVSRIFCWDGEAERTDGGIEERMNAKLLIRRFVVLRVCSNLCGEC